MKFSHVLYHTRDDDFVVVIGTDAIKSYKLSIDQPPKPRDVPFAKKDNKDSAHSKNYVSYCLLKKEEVMIIGTDYGELLIFNHVVEFKMILPDSPRNYG